MNMSTANNTDIQKYGPNNCWESPRRFQRYPKESRSLVNPHSVNVTNISTELNKGSNKGSLSTQFFPKSSPQGSVSVRHAYPNDIKSATDHSYHKIKNSETTRYIKQNVPNTAPSSHKLINYIEDKKLDCALLPPSETAGDDADREEIRRLRRQRLKLKKEVKKQEKALLREEEILKKRLAPKSQKLTIIDHNVMERMMTKEATSQVVEPKGNTSCNVFDFPALGEVTRSANISSSQFQKSNRKGDSNKTEISFEKQVPVETSQKTKVNLLNDTTLQHSNPKESESVNIDVKVISEAKPIFKKNIIVAENKESGRRPKRRDPIQLNLTDILKVQESKQEISAKQHVSKSTQKAEVSRYAGNILDSDNPERKRGKQREIPKPKKPSTLKQIILKERAKRKEARLQESSIKTNKINSNEMAEAVSTVKENSIGEDKIIFNDFSISTQMQSESDKSNNNEAVALLEIKTNESTNFSKYNKEKEHVGMQLINVPIIIENDSIIIENKYQKKMKTQKIKSDNGISETKFQQNVGVLETGDAAPTCAEVLPKRQIHNRKFRNYCDHCINPDILTATTALLEDIVKFHDRQYARSPLKASAKRRHVTGLKEVRKFLALRRIRLLVIAPDLEPTSASGGLDEIVSQLKESAIANQVPYVFALGRRQLGYVLKKKVPVSCVGVLNYEGTDHNFRNLMSAIEKAREEYKLKVMELPLVSSEQIVETNHVDEAHSVNEDGAKNDVNEVVIASLLAKLTIPRKIENTTPFLKAIEHCSSLDDEYDE